MDRRAVAGLALAVSLLACGSDVPETASGGQVSQFVAYRRYSVQPRLDVVVVVSTSAGADGAALRASVVDALRTRMHQRADTDSWLRELDNPIDVRGTVASAFDGSIRHTASDRSALVWQQGNATLDGADTFAAGLASAIDAVPDGDASSAAVVLTVQRALEAAASPPDAERLVVVVSTSDDPAPASLETPVRRRGADDSIVVVVPRSPLAAPCAPAPAPGLASWAKANDASLQTPCSGVDLQTSFVDYAADCLPRPPATREGEPPACRVRAFVPPGTACDASRGWRPLVGASARPLDLSLAAMDVCEVMPLGPLASGRCRDPAERYAGGASGWCLPAPSRACAVAAAPRMVGAAAPPFAHIEIACDLIP